LQLGKAPIAHGMALLATPFGSLAKISEVLQDQEISWLAGAHNLLGGDMVRISLKRNRLARFLGLLEALLLSLHLLFALG